MTQAAQNPTTKVFLVIHVKEKSVALSEAKKATEAGIDGLFFISHRGADQDVIEYAHLAKKLHPETLIGINLLTQGPVDAWREVLETDLDMAWGDHCGITSDGKTDFAEQLMKLQTRESDKQLFASVAFKYQRVDPNPPLAAKIAMDCGFIPTTSGEGTGKAPTVQKIAAMSESTNGLLAVASGMTVDNVALYAPYLSHILVATGVALNEYEADPVLLAEFLTAVRTTFH